MPENNDLHIMPHDYAPQSGAIWAWITNSVRAARLGGRKVGLI